MTHQGSFDPEVMTILRDIMSKIEVDFETIDDSMRQTLAARIMEMAGRGETDPNVIRSEALRVLDRFTPRKQRVL